MSTFFTEKKNKHKKNFKNEWYGNVCKSKHSSDGKSLVGQKVLAMDTNCMNRLWYFL